MTQTTTITEEQLRAWLRAGDDAFERAVRVSNVLRERLEEMERIRARLVAERDRLVLAARRLDAAVAAGDKRELDTARALVAQVLAATR